MTNLALRAYTLELLFIIKSIYFDSAEFVVYLSQIKCHHSKLLRQNFYHFDGRIFFNV